MLCKQRLAILPDTEGKLTQPALVLKDKKAHQELEAASYIAPAEHQSASR